jgi:hypothetical protein
VNLPPTLDEAIRLVRRQHSSITVGDLADAVIAKGWDVERDVLIDRIRLLFPSRQAASAPPPSAPAPVTNKGKNKSRGVRDPGGQKKKRPKVKATQDYCPKCHAFVVMTRRSGVTTVAEHVSKKGGRCPQSGQPFTPKQPLRTDALEYRVPGSFGTGKRG